MSTHMLHRPNWHTVVLSSYYSKMRTALLSVMGISPIKSHSEILYLLR